MGRYCSYLLHRQDGGASQIYVNRQDGSPCTRDKALKLWGERQSSGGNLSLTLFPVKPSRRPENRLPLPALLTGMPLDNVVTQPLKWLYYFPSPDAGLCRTPPPSFFTPARNAESDIGCGKQASEAAVVVGVDCQMKEKMVFLSECARWAPFVIFV